MDPKQYSGTPRPSSLFSHLWVALGEVGFMNSGVDLVIIFVDVLFLQTFSKDIATIFEHYYVSRVHARPPTTSPCLSCGCITKWTRKLKSKAIVGVFSLFISNDIFAYRKPNKSDVLVIQQYEKFSNLK